MSLEPSSGAHQTLRGRWKEPRWSLQTSLQPSASPSLSGPQFPICRMGVSMDVNRQPNRAAAKLEGKDPSSPRDSAQVQRLVLCLPLACRTPASPHRLSVKAVSLPFSLGHTPSLFTSLWLPSAPEKSKLVAMAAKALPSSAASSPTAQPPQCPVPAQSGPCTAWHCPAPHWPVHLENPSLHLHRVFPGPLWILTLTPVPFLSTPPVTGAGQRALHATTHLLLPSAP